MRSLCSRYSIARYPYASRASHRIIIFTAQQQALGHKLGGVAIHVDARIGVVADLAGHILMESPGQAAIVVGADVVAAAR